MRIKILGVSEVNNYIKKTIDNDFILNNLSVKGEISNLKYHSSGHIYFSLKDDLGKINCIMFKSDAVNLDFTLKEGLEVIVKARASIYQATGSLQLYCGEIEESGVGTLHIKFQKLKDKLSKEGLFDNKYKKDIPQNIKRLGVVTADTGAAIHDILNVSRRRNSSVDIVLYPAKVQGEGGYKTIIDGINYFNFKKTVDVIIIGRGGGSIEELWNFNEEELAYAIFKSKIPIISAVGHEVDYTISDFVSDLRAATPSQAAEIAVANKQDMVVELLNIKTLLNKNVDSIINREKNRLESLEKILSLHSPIAKISNSYIELDRIKKDLNKIIINRLNEEKNKLRELNMLLIANNPLTILDKGFSIVKDENGVIKSKDELKESKNIEIIFKDGSIKGKFNPN
ncbi:MAG: exodeoxyribonuclease VII large subunit [Clostridium baratii]|uniref:exodeoxyribonuclease VII large subunit n=1 Tax=Clostridium baratii TaxID=1561 RepID=UPI0006BAFF42|nr:exodeoxyribonuclease VII large subunit [Clostridium baratii]MBS6043596.1 exodeoxyribonuclease VII large subunit [Clostridium baratii]